MKGQKLQKRKVLLFWILLFLFPVSVNAAERERGVFRRFGIAANAGSGK